MQINKVWRGGVVYVWCGVFYKCVGIVRGVVQEHNSETSAGGVDVKRAPKVGIRRVCRGAVSGAQKGRTTAARTKVRHGGVVREGGPHIRGEELLHQDRRLVQVDLAQRLGLQVVPSGPHSQ